MSVAYGSRCNSYERKFRLFMVLYRWRMGISLLDGNEQVGKVSVEWLAGEKTKVVGTFPPKKKGWTGYVEKDTAGQTNIYSVEVCE